MQAIYMELRHLFPREIAGEIIKYLNQNTNEDEEAEEIWEEIDDQRVVKFKWLYEMVRMIRDFLGDTEAMNYLYTQCARILDLKV